MNRSDAPAKQSKPFGINGQREPILPTTPAGDNTASYELGFPPITMILKSAGGLPPKGQDMNQILFELSSLARWTSSGSLNGFDSSFSTAIGGYPSGAFVLGNDLKTVYRCTTDGNTGDPNVTTTGWVKAANDVADILGLGSAAKANTGDFISSSGGNYPAYLRMTGLETLPTETAAANLSSLYSAPSPIQPGTVAAGGVANWYGYQAIWGLIRNASNGINGWGVQINGSTLFLVAPNGDCYANSQKLATETFVTNGLSSKQAKDQTLTDLSGKNQAQLRDYLQLGTAAQKTIGNGSGQVPDMSFFPLVGGANGYVKLPNGFIFQWGVNNAGAGSASIPFPLVFPGGCVGVEITGTSARASADASLVNIIAGEINTGGFGVNGYQVKPGGQVVLNGIAFNWCAWGY